MAREKTKDAPQGGSDQGRDMAAESRKTDRLVNHPWSFILKGNNLDESCLHLQEMETRFMEGLGLA